MANAFLRVFFVVGALLFWAVQSYAAVEAVPGEYVVRFHRDKIFSTQSLSQSLKRTGMTIKKVINADESVYLVKTDLSLLNSFETLSAREDCERVEPNYIYRASMGSPGPGEGTPPQEGAPNDERFSSLWALNNFGQADATGRAGKETADIEALEAWKIQKGSKKIVVAVIDTGIDYRHPDLEANIWSHPDRPNVHGFNAIDGSSNALDDAEHGTHVAGTIGASANNTMGIAGVNWKVSLMAVKFLDRDGGGYLSDAIKAIDFAVENGAHIINASWGGGGRSEELEAAIARARDAGVLFVAAAGNSSANNDVSPSYPASYKLSNVISVASTNNIDALSSFSNFGENSVHLAAPGEAILSTVPHLLWGFFPKKDPYATFSGTSMASPHVAGAAALLLAQDSSLSPEQVRSRIMSTVDPLTVLRGKTISGGRLNIRKMLAN